VTPLVDIAEEGGDWSGVGPQTLAPAAAEAALRAAGIEPERVSISLLFADDAAIAALNGRFRGKAAPTNVLSWPAFDLAAAADGAAPAPPPLTPQGRLFLGDVALAAGVVAKEARDRNLAVGHHAAHLIVHGVLHLLGYDHGRDADATLMEALERRALDELGIADPYA
jgi:probable rRNA maturation factor